MTREDVKYCLLLSLSVILSYFQLAFFVFSTKWDNLSAFFAYKYTASEWWLNAKIPFWDPFQNLGYPMHANPQGYVWYPITWLLNLPNGYTLHSLNIETVLHVIIASLGMYFLAKWIKMKPSIAFLAGLVYGLSGFIIGSNHMIGFTIGAAWLPWTILFLLRLLHQTSVRDIVLLSIVCYFHITGAYIAFTIVLIYIFLFLIAHHIFSNWSQKFRLKQMVIGLLTTLFLTIVLSSPYLFSIYDSMEYFSRAKALSYDVGNYSGNFSWECFQSLIAPYINSSNTGFTGVDVSLFNIYIGIIPLLCFIVGLILIRFRFKKLYLIGMVFFLLLGLGIYTPFHMWITKLLPGFNLFRHPYLFTLYFTLQFILFVFKTLSSLNEQTLVQIRKGILAGLIIIGIIWIISLIKSETSELSCFFREVSQLREKTSFSKYFHAFIQLTISLFILTILYLNSKNIEKFKKALPILIFLDLFISIQLSGPTNMYYNVPFRTIENNLHNLSNSNLTNQEFNTPLLELSNDKIEAQAGFWVNLNTYKRTTGIDGYNPFIYSSYEDLKQSEEFKSLLQQGIFHSDDDTMKLSEFELGYNSFQIKSNNASNSLLYLNQNYHHNWRAYINGKKQDVQKTAGGLMSLKVPAGPQVVQFKYESKKSVLLFITSFLLFIVSIAYLLITKTKLQTRVRGIVSS